MATGSFTLPDAAAVVSPEEAEGTYEHNPNHVEEAIAHLIQFFRDGPRNQALMTALATQVQEAEDAAWDVATAFDLDTAEGHQLELLGKLVGELRAGRLDDDYRAAIRVRVMVNASEGTMPELVAIAAGIAPAAVITAAESYPAAFSLEISDLGSVTVATAYGLLKAAKPAGVRLNFGVGEASLGSADGDPLGGELGSADGDPAGFVLGSGA